MQGRPLGPRAQRVRALDEECIERRVLTARPQQPLDLVWRARMRRIARGNLPPRTDRADQVVARLEGDAQFGPVPATVRGGRPLGSRAQHLDHARDVAARPSQGHEALGDDVVLRGGAPELRQRGGLRGPVARAVAVQVGQSTEHGVADIALFQDVGPLRQDGGELLPASLEGEHLIHAREGLRVFPDAVENLAPRVERGLRIIEALERDLGDLPQPGDAHVRRALFAAHCLRQNVAQGGVVAARPEVVFDQREGLEVRRIKREHPAHRVEHSRAVTRTPLDLREIFEVPHLLHEVALDREHAREPGEVLRAAGVAVEAEHRAGDLRVIGAEGLERGDGVVDLPDGQVRIGERLAYDRGVRARRIGLHEGDLSEREVIQALLRAVRFINDGKRGFVPRPGVEGRLREGQPVLAPDALRERREQGRSGAGVVRLGRWGLRPREIRAGQFAQQLPVIGLRRAHLLEPGDLRVERAEAAMQVGAFAQEHRSHEGVGRGAELALEELRREFQVAELEIDLPRGLDRAELRWIALKRAGVVGDRPVRAPDVLRPELCRPKEEIGGGLRVCSSARGLLDQGRELLKLSPPPVVLPQERQRLGVVGVFVEALVAGVGGRVHRRAARRYHGPSSDRNLWGCGAPHRDDRGRSRGNRGPSPSGSPRSLRAGARGVRRRPPRVAGLWRRAVLAVEPPLRHRFHHRRWLRLQRDSRRESPRRGGVRSAIPTSHADGGAGLGHHRPAGGLDGRARSRATVGSSLPKNDGTPSRARSAPAVAHEHSSLHRNVVELAHGRGAAPEPRELPARGLHRVLRLLEVPDEERSAAPGG